MRRKEAPDKLEGRRKESLGAVRDWIAQQRAARMVVFGVGNVW